MNFERFLNRLTAESLFVNKFEKRRENSNFVRIPVILKILQKFQNCIQLNQRKFSIFGAVCAPLRAHLEYSAFLSIELTVHGIPRLRPLRHRARVPFTVRLILAWRLSLCGSAEKSSEHHEKTFRFTMGLFLACLVDTVYHFGSYYITTAEN